MQPSDKLIDAVESPLYAAGIGLFGLGLRVASLRNRKARLLAAGQRETWRRLAALPSDRPVVWLHAASLGEFEQGRPIIESIRKKYPGYRVLLTFFSPSGYEVRKNYDGADLVCYLPLDTPRNARRFVERVKPAVAIFVKYEIWRNYLRVLDRRGIPAYLVSACFQPNQAFFKPWGKRYRNWLRMFRHIFVQDSGSRRLLEDTGFSNVTVAGDTRFDRVSAIAAEGRVIPELEAFKGEGRRLVFMAGSSWPADEAIYGAWLNRRPDVKAVIAPHEFDGARLRNLKALFGDDAVLLSEVRKAAAEGNDAEEMCHRARVLIIDCFGLLSAAYRYADIAYVGGGFGTGIHNINEAAVFGIPVLFGPEHHRFLEAEEMKTLGGGISVDSRESFERQADILYHDVVERERRGRWAGEYIAEKCGATSRIMEEIFPAV